jgi:hypothetical protein
MAALRPLFVTLACFVVDTRGPILFRVLAVTARARRVLMQAMAEPIQRNDLE